MGTGIEASLTGHLVFATLHTNSAPESIIRLLDMGMDPFNFSDALLGILAQRLAKRLCASASRPTTRTAEEIKAFLQEYCERIAEYHDLQEGPEGGVWKACIAEWVKTYGNDKGQFTLYKQVGCEKCGGSGYKGRGRPARTADRHRSAEEADPGACARGRTARRWRWRRACAP